MARKNYQYRSGGLLLTAVVALLAFGAAVDVVLIPLNLWEVSIYERAESPDVAQDFALQADADSMSVAVGAAAILAVLIFLVTAICFLCLTYRAGANAHTLAPRVQYAAGWAVGWYFVPFLNLVRPYQAMAEYFRASRPRSEGGVPEHWQDNRVPGLLRVWWGLWLLGGVLGQVSARMAMQEPGVGDFSMAKTACYLSIGESLIGVASAATAIWMFRTLFHWQSERRQEKRSEPDVGEGRDLAATCRECGEALPVGADEPVADPDRCPMCGAEHPARRDEALV
ncbi:DUF4328 domain-containing protein [Alienimonas sp. DA493]|uniref:DUF4328 domain-containing protein n=1 Tax=Alienimonas sp. DA493 TaxID=3373605 RepID=UPI00375481CB